MDVDALLNLITVATGSWALWRKSIKCPVPGNSLVRGTGLLWDYICQDKKCSKFREILDISNISILDSTVSTLSRTKGKA